MTLSGMCLVIVNELTVNTFEAIEENESSMLILVFIIMRLIGINF